MVYIGSVKPHKDPQRPGSNSGCVPKLDRDPHDRGCSAPTLPGPLSPPALGAWWGQLQAQERPSLFSPWPLGLLAGATPHCKPSLC